jgi:uncharacterized membrane protein
MVSLTTLVLTVTLVAVQLAMGQFSPRIVGALLTDRWSQLAIGLFGASFLVAVLTLREIRGSDTGTVPGLSAGTAASGWPSTRSAWPGRRSRR